MAPDIVAFGEPMIEFNQRREGDGRAYLQGFGGDTSNFAIAAARQGARVGYVSAVGADPYGEMLKALWRDEGVDAAEVAVDADGYTAIYLVTHGDEGHRFTFFRSGSAAARYSAARLPTAYVGGARYLHLSGISLAISPSACDACYAAIAAARSGGALVSFDTNLRLRLWTKERARAVMTDVMRLADICLPSLDDLSTVTGLTDPDALIDYVLSLGPRVVALKLGSEGAVVADGSVRVRLPPHPCRPVDATGAGDTFGGAFVARIAAGDTVEEAGRYAVVAAALSTEGYGAVAPIPRAHKVLEALRGRR